MHSSVLTYRELWVPFGRRKWFPRCCWPCTCRCRRAPSSPSGSGVSGPAGEHYPDRESHRSEKNRNPSNRYKVWVILVFLSIFAKLSIIKSSWWSLDAESIVTSVFVNKNLLPCCFAIARFNAFSWSWHWNAYLPDSSQRTIFQKEKY